MKLILNTIKILLGSLAAVAISIAMTMGVSMCSPRTVNAGPGMIVSFGGTVKGISIAIKDARLPDGKEFPNAGSFGHSNSPISGGATMGAAPDGRQLPEWVDFEWQETPYPWDQRPSQSDDEWREEIFATYRALPVKTQRVLIRSRIPQAVVDEVTEANRHPVPGMKKHLELNLVWTSQGIKLRWRIWNTPDFNAQYDSHEGGDEIIPEGTTMIAVYASMMKDVNVSVNPGGAARHPALPGQGYFSGSPNFVSMANVESSSGLTVAYENEAQLPQSIDFNWRLFPLVVPRNKGETDTQYQARVQAIYQALPVNNERIPVRSRIPQDVQDEIAAAARKALPDQVSSSIIYLYFIWTDGGIKLRWRLMRVQPDGRHVYPREGGDELALRQAQAILSYA
jgi:hypothetical protein